ncbi:hypothetical protein CY0110_18252 [Crocosphaera chwakensis CCY0110]|uniref:Uncharacterized protein n=1 Tax=Crocosphaera chwakensis CCY0110 TaxID=391612 RepID=A3IIY2_9CHRO|nr:hypothetical protein CY0110_18252 [Crocosphaera chwakensis CCY0110]
MASVYPSQVLPMQPKILTGY